MLKSELRCPTCRCHVLRCLDWLEANEWDLHRAEQADDEEGVVRDVHSGGVSKRAITHDLIHLISMNDSPAHEEEGEYMERDEVDDEDVPAPGGDHVEVGESAPSGPIHRAGLHCLDPQVIPEIFVNRGGWL